MLATLLTLVLLKGETDYNVRPGDKWTIERTLHYQGGSEEVNFSHVETFSYVVTQQKGGIKLTASWKLKETRFDGEIVPVPKGVVPFTRSIFLKGGPVEGEAADAKMEPEIARYRIERMLSLGRPEPEFWPVPPNVRLVGVEGKPRWKRREDDREVFEVEWKENAGSRPMESRGTFTLDKRGVLLSGRWSVTNVPIPGGDATCDLDVSTKLVEISYGK